MWIVRDKFVRNSIAVLQAMKTEASMDKKPLPYLYSYFNIFCYSQSPLGHVKSIAARILNSIIEGLNARQHLPKYILIIPDEDIVAHFDRYDYGIGDDIEEATYWIIRNLRRLLESRKKDIREKRPGTIMSQAEPRIIWIEMIIRPPNAGIKEVYSLTSKFNKKLYSLVQHDEHSHLMKIQTVNEFQHFDNFGHLIPAGKRKFWNKVVLQMKKLERRETDLQPWKEYGERNIKEKGKNEYSTGDDDSTSKRSQASFRKEKSATPKSNPYKWFKKN